jgi:translation initiation factor IF-2
LLDDRGQRISEAGPSIPVEIWGLDEVPRAGDKLYQVSSMQRAKEVASEMQQYRVTSGRAQASKVYSLEEMFRQRDAGDVPELHLIIKGDVDGSVAALQHALTQIKSDEVKLTVRHAGVGPVNDSDILLAATCRGIAIAFRVDVPVGARRLAEQNGVDVRSYRVIYDVVDEIKKALEGLLAPEERVEGRAALEVKEVFNITRVGTVAGSMVVSGTVDRSHLAKIIRDGAVVREGCRFASVRRFKDDVKEVRTGMECGVRLDGFNDVHVGDRIETYEIVKIARTL